MFGVQRASSQKMKQSGKRFAAMALILVLLFGWHGRAIAAQTTVDFQALAGAPRFDLPVPDSAKLSNQLAPTYGVVFSSGTTKPYVAVIALSNITHGIMAVDENDIPSYLVPLRIDFVQPSDPSTAATTDFVSVHPLLCCGSVTIEALAANGALVGSQTGPGSGHR